MNKIIRKVDRVSTVEEALQLQSLGVEMIGTVIDSDENFNDNRVIPDVTAFEISQRLSSSKFVVELSVKDHFDETLERVEKLGVDYLQPLENRILPLDFQKTLSQKGIGIIYSNIEVSYDDDPSWILSPFLDEYNVDLSYYQIELLGDIENSWHFLQKECPTYSEELQISDINQIAKQHPLLITLDYSPENILDIINFMPQIKGVSMVLGSNPMKNNLHFLQYSKVLEILDLMKQKSSMLSPKRSG